MDRELSKEFIKSRRRRRILKNGVYLIIVILAFALGRSLLFPKLNRDTIRTAITERGSIENTISASGVVIPEFELALTSPIDSRIEAGYISAGEDVDRGLSILKLNTESLESRLEKMGDELKLKKNVSLTSPV